MMNKSEFGILTNFPSEHSIYKSLSSFSLEQKIGKGQFSVVYKARCTIDNSIVALKKVQICEIKNSKARIDYMKEINLLKQLDHENIIKNLASFVEMNELYIVMELADGGDLAKMISYFRKQKRLISEKTIWKYFVQIASGVDHMHSRRIIHRDIKPANVFVTTNGIIKLGDLGLGRFFSPKTMVSHSLVGTPYYMAPERITNAGHNFKSDIWSLGCLLYEMAALQSPFYGDKMSMFTLFKKITIGDFPPIPSDLYTQQLKDLISCCIRTEAECRPDTTYVYAISKDMNDYFQKNTPLTKD